METFQAALKKLGYGVDNGATLRRHAPTWGHPFAPELRAAMTPRRDGDASASAIYCVDDVPAVCLVDGQQLPNDADARGNQVRLLCERLWNQNLISVVLVVDQAECEAWSVINRNALPDRMPLEQASALLSPAAFASGKVVEERPSWFDPVAKVDQSLLDNILALVEQLRLAGVDGTTARLLIARSIFVCYLEHRGIVGPAYRKRRSTKIFFDLVREQDREGLDHLIICLRDDFNGDFLSPKGRVPLPWSSVSDEALKLLATFLSRTDLRTGQTSFWRYDFSEIPVELISGIYETFLSSKDQDEGERSEDGESHKKKLGAFYTPRALASYVVNEALLNLDPLEQVIYDGACGSGILLTTAYRRLIREAESRRGATLTFDERKALLESNIRGSDLDDDACRLTAFSLYLALLSGLEPADLTLLEEQGGKLPNLLDKTIFKGDEGDFFKVIQSIGCNARPSIIISNPPWREPKQTESHGFEDWLNSQSPPLKVPRRQIAMAFALGAADAVRPNGRIALILPATPFVTGSGTNANFRRHLLGRMQIEKIVNFSDMRRLIFADAVHPFVVIVGTARAKEKRCGSLYRESFTYLSPKADLALALGRLAVHASDQVRLTAGQLAEDGPLLGLRYWGTEADISLLERLQATGTVGDLTEEGRWTIRKGFHLTDGEKRAAAPEWLRREKFLPTKGIPQEEMVIRPECLIRFPHETIAQIPPKNIVFGPRVLWPDGTHAENGVKAVYSDMSFSFQHSTGVVAGPEEDRLLLRFLTLYMRSSLGLYMMLLLSSSVSGERPKLHLSELRQWPFVRPEDHDDPEAASAIIGRADHLLTAYEGRRGIGIFVPQAHDMRASIDDLVFEYFQLAEDETAIVREMVDVIGPSIQPSSRKPEGLLTALQRSPERGLLADYASRLATEMNAWKEGSGGRGEIVASVISDRKRLLGAAVLELRDSTTDDLSISEPVTEVDDIITVLSDTLTFAAMSHSPDRIMSLPNVTIMKDRYIYLIKPLRTRFWLERAAIEDAARLVSEIQAVGATGGKE